jgi:hypothetical protein
MRANVDGSAQDCHVTPTTYFLVGALLGVKQKVSKDFFTLSSTTRKPENMKI